MSSDLLRRAATKMREQAEAATPGEPAWYPGRKGGRFETVGEVYSSREPSATSSDVCSWASHEDAVYIAGMHPGVASAFADWLDSVASADRHEINGADMFHAVTAARAFLNEPAEDER